MTVTEIIYKTHGCGERVLITVPIPGGTAKRPVDQCLARVILALNKAGIPTTASCCGHGVVPGSIVLADGTHITTPKCTRYGA